MLVDGSVKDVGVLRQELSIPYDIFLTEWEKRGLYVTIVRRANVFTLHPIDH